MNWNSFFDKSIRQHLHFNLITSSTRLLFSPHKLMVSNCDLQPYRGSNCGRLKYVLSQFLVSQCNRNRDCNHNVKPCISYLDNSISFDISFKRSRPYVDYHTKKPKHIIVFSCCNNFGILISDSYGFFEERDQENRDGSSTCKKFYCFYILLF